MEYEAMELPWEALKHTEGEIPFSALSQFAAAVVRDESLTDALMDLYEQAWETESDQPHYEDLYVPAILALAAPQLSEQRRRQIGELLIEKLVEAGRVDDELSLEVLSAACGCMGPVILPAVLAAIKDEPDTGGAWIHLWGLTELAARTDDPEVRATTIRACMGALEKAEQGEIDPFDMIGAAWTLALMKCSDAAGLLERLKAKTDGYIGSGDYAGALDLLKGCLDCDLPPRSWEQPVKEWLEPNWKAARNWYFSESPESDNDEATAYNRIQELTGQFLDSVVAAELGDEVLEDAGFIVQSVLQYAWDYRGVGADELDKAALAEVLLELLPRKVTADRECFARIAPVTGAFLKWMESEGILGDTSDLIETVHSWADAIVANGMNPEYWGMGKSFMMRAKAEGVDIDDQAAVQKFMAEYNLRLMAARAPERRKAPDFTPPIPIVEQSPKIGRNEPCPCGSGRKYKKCCGSVRH